MQNFIITLISSFITCFALIIEAKILLNKKTDLKKYTFWIIYISFSLYVTLSYMTITNFLKIIPTFILLVFIIYKLFNVNLLKAAFLSMIELIVLIISEIIYVLSITSLLNLNIETLKNNVFGNILTNIIISLIFIIILNINKIEKRVVKTINKNIKQNNKSLYVLFIMLILVITMILYYIYFDIDLKYALVFCLVLIGAYTFLSFKVFSEKISNINLNAEYAATLNSLEEYEKLYSYQRMLNHEFKNDLLVIRGMSNKNNKKLTSYIDELVDNKNSQSEKWLDLLKKIPSGGLRGILYYKLTDMENSNINVDLEIERTFSIKNYNKLSDETKIKICKLIGIYLDNAKKALDKVKNKNVMIIIREDSDQIIISITNNFSDNTDLSRITEKGYSTNGKGHGYGLAIAKDLIDSDKSISNEIQINGSNFEQIIKIKMWKHLYFINDLGHSGSSAQNITQAWLPKWATKLATLATNANIIPPIYAKIIKII